MSEQHTITCDYCGRVESMGPDKTFSYRYYYRPAGWKFEEGKDFCCNECRKAFLIDANRPDAPREFGWFERILRRLAA